MKFKPFDIFAEKEIKNNKEPGDDPNLEPSEDDLIDKWKNLSEKKIRKFVKKAEKRYDREFEENKQLPLLCTFLNPTEFQYLFESYGQPAKLPENSLLYYIKKCSEQTEPKSKDVEKSWSNLTDKEKQEITKEYKNVKRDYEEKYAIFLRNLPEERFKDYTEAHIHERVVLQSENKPSKKKSKDKIDSPDKKFIPYDIFKERFREKNPDLTRLEIQAQSRNKFKLMSNKKKLVFVKEAEANFDAEISKPKLKPGLKKSLSDYLNKAELTLLFESYGMPKNVPSNLNAYYFSQYCAEIKSKEPKDNVLNGNNMKQCNEKLQKMEKSEKDDLFKKHAKEYEEFKIKIKQFLDKLPYNRLNDYYGSKGVKKSPSKIKKSKGKIEESDEELVPLNLEVDDTNNEDNDDDNEKDDTKKEDEKEEKKDEDAKKSEDEDEKSEDEDAKKSVDEDAKKSEDEYAKKSEEEDEKKSEDEDEKKSEDGDDGDESSDEYSDNQEIQSFVKNHSSRPENSFSIFLSDQIKWKGLKIMNEYDSRAFLVNVAHNWLNMNNIEKKEFEDSFTKSKKDLAKKIKEFSMNKQSETNIEKVELVDKINKLAYKVNRKIRFIFSENESINGFLNEVNSEIISPLVNQIDLVTKETNEIENNRLNEKRKINGELSQIPQVAKKSKK